MNAYWKNLLYKTVFVVLDNSLLIVLTGFFVYWKFFNGRENLALLTLIGALSLTVICRWLAYYAKLQAVRLVYQGLLVVSLSLIFAALCIQTTRFVFVFLPGLSEPTLPKILVRLGIFTAVCYVYALCAVFLYYLHVHQILALIWHGSVEHLIDSGYQISSYQRQNWQRLRFSSRLVVWTLFGGGLASGLTLAVGLVAWLLR